MTSQWPWPHLWHYGIFHHRRIIHPLGTRLHLPSIERRDVTTSWRHVFVGLTLAPGRGGVTGVGVMWRAEVEEPRVIGGAAGVLTGRHQTSAEENSSVICEVDWTGSVQRCWLKCVFFASYIHVTIIYYRVSHFTTWLNATERKFQKKKKNRMTSQTKGHRQWRTHDFLMGSEQQFSSS